ncbi:MAG: cobalamin biosynthesis protein CbiG [Desulfobacteraceae bacterium]|nr:cobalamin biosynthesis protein CbiG [Desulfobacteraceae bacterium]
MTNISLMDTVKKNKLAVWVLTPNGLAIAQRLTRHWQDAHLFCSQRIAPESIADRTTCFDSLMEAVGARFNDFGGHLFIMACGIVVRAIAPHLVHKTCDPAVVVIDDRGNYAVSLVSGHLGGANKLAGQAASVLGAVAVITTATDVNQKLAIDVLAGQHGLKIENPEAIKHINMALLEDTPVALHDPFGILGSALANTAPFEDAISLRLPGLFIDDKLAQLPETVLVLRPAGLIAGIGCNRNTDKEEIKTLLFRILDSHGLAAASLAAIASIDLKANEAGLQELAGELDLPFLTFSKMQLQDVKQVPNPSEQVNKHIGVPSVCEAAAILAARKGPLIVPKHKTRNVTVAIARRKFA